MSATRRTARTAVIGLALASMAVPSHGEVRLRHAGPSAPPALVVRATAQGLWFPLGPVDETVLNPAGDLFSDAMPGQARSATSLVVAWIRPGAGITTARGERGAWHAGSWLNAPQAQGTPVLASLDGGFALAWQEAGPQPAVALATANGTGTLTTLTPIVDGALVDMTRIAADTVVVLGLTPDGMLTTVVVLMSHIPTPEPLPFPPTVLLVPTPTSVPILIPAAVQYTTLEPLIDPSLYTPSPDPLPFPPTSLAAADIRLNEGRKLSGGDFVLATWWVSPNELHWIELTADGPAFPIGTLTTRGNVQHSQALVQQAINEVRKR